MQGIFTYIPETNYGCREYSVECTVFYISTFRSMCAVLNMAVFYSSLTSCFPGILLTYFINDFEIVQLSLLLLLLLLLLFYDYENNYWLHNKIPESNYYLHANIHYPSAVQLFLKMKCIYLMQSSQTPIPRSL